MDIGPSRVTFEAGTLRFNQHVSNKLPKHPARTLASRARVRKPCFLFLEASSAGLMWPSTFLSAHLRPHPNMAPCLNSKGVRGESNQRPNSLATLFPQNNLEFQHLSTVWQVGNVTVNQHRPTSHRSPSHEHAGLAPLTLVLDWGRLICWHGDQTSFLRCLEICLLFSALLEMTVSKFRISKK